MFDAPRQKRSTSLLMADAPEVRAHTADPADVHRKAKAKRMSRQAPPLTTALGQAVDTPEPPQDNNTQTNAAAPAARAVEPPPPQVEKTMPRQEELRSSAAFPDSGYGQDWQSRALIDPAIILSTLWNWRWPIAGLTGVGAALGVFLALTSPKHYTAIAQVLIDPRQIKLAERDLTPEFLANEAALAIIDSKLPLVTSTPVLTKVVERTNLAEDGEFNGAQSNAAAGLSLITSIITGSDGGQPSERAALENLRDSIDASRAPRTFNVSISATSQSPDKAALLANEIANAFIEEQSGLQVNSARTATEALTGRLTDLQKNVAEAETKVEEFRSANNLLNAQGRPITEDELLALSGAVTRARAATIDAKAKADEARTATLDSVLSGGLPSAMVTPALTTFRAQYASLRQQLASQQNQLGPRHPRITTTRAAAESARAEIGQELQRIVAGTQADLRSAIENERQLAAELAGLKAKLSNSSDESVQLDELEREAAVAREIYQNALLRARETGEMEAVGQTNASLIGPAEPPSTASSLSRKLIVIGSTLAGFAAGVGLALLSGIAKSLKLATSDGQSIPHRPRPEPSGPRDGGGTKRRFARFKDDQTSTETAQPEADKTMYPQQPYQPYPAFQQPQPQQPVYAPMPQPQPHYAPQFQQMPPQPQAYGMPMQQPMMHYQPWMQQPVMPYQPQPSMMPQAHYVYVTTPPAQQQVQPVPVQQEAAPRNDIQAESDKRDRERQAEDINLLRQSVSDIRDVLDHLTARRFG